MAKNLDHPRYKCALAATPPKKLGLKAHLLAKISSAVKDPLEGILPSI